MQHFFKIDASLAAVFEQETHHHVTELRQSYSRGLDCSGHIESWQDARLKILDGLGSAHMRVDTFCGILKKGLAALPELKDAPVLIEVGHGNKNLTLITPGAIELSDNRAIIR